MAKGSKTMHMYSVEQNYKVYISDLPGVRL